MLEMSHIEVETSYDYRVLGARQKMILVQFLSN